MTEQTLTALYDTRDAAAAVRDELVRLGVPGGRVTVQGNGGGAGTAGAGVTRTTTATTESLAATGQDRAAGPGSLGAAATGGNTVQLAEDQLRVGKREVGGGRVRVRSYVVERPVEEQVNLRQERVEVERRPVDREVSPGDAPFQERTIEATERGEEAVVDKQARVVEEVGLRKDVDTRTETVRDTVRKTEVEVEDERAVAGTERVTTERDRTGG